MWFFFSPNIIYGEDALDFFENIAGEKCFIMTDKIIQELGYLKILTDKLDKYGKSYTVFTEILPDPREESVIKAREECLNYDPDLILALGGGSVMDVAKTVWALYEFPELKLDDIHPFRTELYEMGKKAKMIALPTTSGTGSETTFATVISKLEEDIWKKYLYIHRGLIPTYAIVDPIFPKGMPLELTINTAFDALSHSIEGIGNFWKNEFSDALALKAIELIFEYLPIAVKDGSNIQARDYLHQASTIAGLTFGNSNAHIGHSLGHSWGAMFHVPHGRCVGIVLKYVIEFILINHERVGEVIQIFAKLAKQLGWVNWDDDDKKAAYKVIEKLIELQEKVGFPLNLKETGVTREDLENNMDALISLTFQDATAALSPRSPSAEDFKKLYLYSFDGKDVDF